jgi:AcrR family transcriptional regulator
MPKRGTVVHPTKTALLVCVAELLDTHQISEINVELVCQTSGISLGSLYHHHNDLPSLIDSALVYRFARFIDAAIAQMNEAVASSQNKAEFFAGLRTITRTTQARELVNARLERAGSHHRAANSPSFRMRLGAEQQRLTDELAQIISTAQAKGWVNPEIDARAGAVMLQAYSLGRVVDDIASNQMDDQKWVELIDMVADKIFSA